MTQYPSADCSATEASIKAEITAHVATVRDVEARCKAAFLPLLHEHGITRVEISYDGSGDEGFVGDVLAYSGDQLADIPAIQCDHYSLDFKGEVHTSAIQLEEALSAFGENVVCDHHCGWENGEGAHGTIAIDVGSATVTLTHNERFIDYNIIETEI